MYSPKIDEKLVPSLYQIAKAKGIPMARLVNLIVADAIKNIHVETQVVSREIPEEVFVIADKGSSLDS